MLSLGIHLTTVAPEDTRAALLALLPVAKATRLSRAQTPAIIRALNHLVPPFTYFGPHPAHRDELGVWVDLSKLHVAEERGQIVQVTDDRWPGRSRWVLRIDDGLALYRRKGRLEVWRTR